jgi:phage replication-related protein YjqB (UPF0714/DUF867 family)
VSLGDLLATPGVTERSLLAGGFGFLAFHGGLEGGTETVAAAAAAPSGASLYTLVQPASLRWHLPSHVIGATSSPALDAFLAHVDVAVAVHGYGRVARPRDILLGGGNRVLAADLAAAIRRHLPDRYRVIDDLDDMPREVRGLHGANPANLPRHGGVQLELPPSARGTTWRWSDAGGPCVPEPGLVDALVEVAAAYRSGRYAATADQPTSNVPPARQ